MHFLVTGHTGFKGAWLTLWLCEQGHQVSGLALDPEAGALFETAELTSLLQHDVRADIRDAANVVGALRLTSPDVVIHLAAQPLVRESYQNPRWTFETNVMGTLNVLEAVQQAASVRAQLIITTDKVYRNVNQVAGYVESDPLGGDDPYSASKAMADLLTHSWVTSFGGPPTAVARAGNVIGGGDVSKDRLIPDVINALKAGISPILRYPNAVRPWQHVLDCLNGYLAIVENLLVDHAGTSDRGAWNFGPDESSFVRVGDVTNLVARRWGSDIDWIAADNAEFEEASLLALDATKATATLGWKNVLGFQEAVEWTVDWFRVVHDGVGPRDCTVEQIAEFDRLRDPSS
jgi:CDP-glucose 4,6-dehydratase